MELHKGSIDPSRFAHLLVIGETSCTGLHGANRLASNSLLEAVVCAHEAANKSKQLLNEGIKLEDFRPWEIGDAIESDEVVVITQNWGEIRHLMWNYVSIVRTNKRLERATARLSLLKEEINDYYWHCIITSDLIELRNLATVAELTIDSALLRKESRGVHYSLDYPNKLPEARDTELKRS